MLANKPIQKVYKENKYCLLFDGGAQAQSVLQAEAVAYFGNTYSL